MSVTGEDTVPSLGSGCCCFTGHRPEKLTWQAEEIQAYLEVEIRRAIREGITCFICGMARGVDIWAAEILLRLKQEFPIQLICAVPFEGFETSWCEDWRERYRRVLRQADDVQYISPSYHRACFRLRNQWMVDRSCRVIAVWNGMPSGTKNTVDYAIRKGVEVIFYGSRDT